MKPLLRWSFRLIVGLFILTFLLVVGVSLLHVQIDLSGLKKPVETIVSKALKRPVTIEKSLVLSTSLKPVFTLGGFRIHNPAGYVNDTFMYLDSAQIELELLPLLRKKIHFSEISVRKLSVILEEKADGDVNWMVASGDGAGEKPSAPKEVSGQESEPKSFELTGDTLVIKKLYFEDISLSYFSPESPDPSRYQMDKCNGAMIPGKPLNLDIVGNLLSFPYTLQISLASLEEFILENRTWMEIQAEIAKTQFVFSGNVDLAEAHRSLSLHATAAGKNLRSLNEVVQFDLPPLIAYSVEANLRLREQQLELENLTVTTGSSSLNGKGMITKEGEQTKVEISLHSPLIQINDFTFDDWSWTDDSSKAVPPEKNTQSYPVSAETNPTRRLLDPDVLEYFSGVVAIRGDQVLSGEDELGSGHLEVRLHDGRVTIEPLQLNIPGGSITASGFVQPGKELADASLKVTMSNFDIGVLARRNNPEAKMEGLVNLDVDVRSSAASLDQMLANGNGYFDFSGQLKNLRAGIIDLWAVNLVAAIVSNTDKNQSQINCAVGRWKVKDGMLTPDVFFIDTSKIRICGKGKVNFKKKKINLTITPTAKRPEFFSLATPLRLQGDFSDMGLGVKKGALLGTAVVFVTSPIHVPVRRVVSKNIPRNGNDACSVALGPDNRTEITVSGCK